MNISDLSSHLLTHAAIISLKNAYDECTEKTAKESIITAFKAIIQLQHDLKKLTTKDNSIEHDCDYDPSEFCAAI